MAPLWTNPDSLGPRQLFVGDTRNLATEPTRLVVSDEIILPTVPISTTSIDCPEQMMDAPSFRTGTIAVTVVESDAEARSRNAWSFTVSPSTARVTTTGTRRRTSQERSKLPSPIGAPCSVAALFIGASPIAIV